MCGVLWRDYSGCKRVHVIHAFHGYVNRVYGSKCIHENGSDDWRRQHFESVLLYMRAIFPERMVMSFHKNIPQFFFLGCSLVASHFVSHPPIDRIISRYFLVAWVLGVCIIHDA